MTAARRDGLLLTAILVAAAGLRLVGLRGRGEFDDDQGAHMLTMLAWVRDGQVPDLGPIGSFGTAHHGVAYYWLLAPGAFLSDADPTVAAATLAVLGVVGVLATWWLGRIVGGPMAGHVAGLLMAVSPAAVSSSTFIWNSNIVGPAAAVSVAASWQAWRTRRPAWWLLSAAGAVIVMQGHLLGVLIVAPLLAIAAADVWRRESGDRRAMISPLLGAAAIVVVAYLPLLVHEVRHDFSETRAIADFVVRGIGRSLPEQPGWRLGALPVIAWRVLATPVAGFAKSAVLLGFPALFCVLVAFGVALFGADGIGRQFSRWAAGTVVWAVIALTLLSPGLGVITPGLPNDQYHAWLQPIVFATVGVAAAHLWQVGSRVERTTAIAVVAACTGLSLAAQPPLRSPDGGWPAGRADAQRIDAVAEGRSIGVVGVAKPGSAITFALNRMGVAVIDPRSADVLVVVCDPLFKGSVGLGCGGSAELATARSVGFPAGGLLDSFANGPRRVICVFTRAS